MTQGAAAQTIDPVPTATADLFSAKILPEPLVPLGKEPSVEDNRLLATNLDAFQRRTRSDDFSELEKNLAVNPASLWRLSVLANLGLLYYHAGLFLQNHDYLPRGLGSWHRRTDLKAKALADRAAGEYIKMLARLGRYKELYFTRRERMPCQRFGSDGA